MRNLLNRKKADEFCYYYFGFKIALFLNYVKINNFCNKHAFFCVSRSYVIKKPTFAYEHYIEG